MARKSALIYVLDNDGKLVDAFIKCETAADPAPTTVELEIARIVKEHREMKAELEAVNNGYTVIGLLMDMQRACPFGCMTFIYIETKDRDPVVFRWEFKLKGERCFIEKRIQWLDLQKSRSKGRIYHNDVTEKIKAFAAKGWDEKATAPESQAVSGKSNQ